jgi:hypothetical protein
MEAETDDRDLYSRMIRLHVLPRAGRQAIFGAGMAKDSDHERPEPICPSTMRGVRTTRRIRIRERHHGRLLRFRVALGERKNLC